MAVPQDLGSVADLDSVLITEELARRPARAPDLRAENGALQELARQMAEGPERLLETLVQMAVTLCDAGTGGLSLVDTAPDGTQVFRWVALAGALADAQGGTTPRDFSPCGVTLERGAPQLFADPGRYFAYFAAVAPPIVEGLVVPLGEAAGTPGTIWIVSHTDERRFDWEDARIMTSLAHFTAAEHARLYHESRAALLLRDDFIASMSHDLRNPLATVKGQAQGLQRRLKRWDDPRQAEPIAQGLAKIEHAATRMAAQLDDLVDLARLQAGQPVEIRRDPTDLGALVSDVVGEHQARHPTHRLRIESSSAELVGRWDGARLARVLDNLLSNAIKYSPAGGEIRIRLAREEDNAIVEVEDHGIGIPTADLPRLFERFHRAANVVGRIDGSGLGLAGSRQFVEAHGGSIVARSQEHVGTTITVRLPLG